MNKKNLKLVVVFGLLALLFVAFSKNHFENEQQKMIVSGEVEYTQKQSQIKEDEQGVLDSLNPELNSGQNIHDYLKYKSLVDNEVSISIFGSSVANGDGASSDKARWRNVLKDKLSTDIKNINVLNHAVGGYSTSKIIETGIVDEVVSENPDLVIFETSVINNHLSSLSMEKTISDIDSILKELTKELPDSKILIISPNPISNENADKNNRNLIFNDYLYETENFANDKGYDYFNLEESMTISLNENNLKISDISGDGIHPNDKGYQIWADVLYDYIVKK